ncbi:hypothetical protein [Aliamphritea spongicola]|nr:hypothetical protein [Aliamphritea spongicola]
MDALALSADPLDFSQEGIIYISVIVGDDDPDPYVSEQHRWLNHGISSLSETWSDCPSWQGMEPAQCQHPSQGCQISQSLWSRVKQYMWWKSCTTTHG